MKNKLFKCFCFTLILALGGCFFSWSGVLKGKASEITSGELKDKLIRFHVLANSDSDEDQKLKLKVRDEVISYIAPKLKESKDIKESREIIKSEDGNIKKIAYECIKKNGYDYKVQTTLGNENFPIKTYGNITLPQGEYEAYRILIGNAEGQNWWCVMFPPLCFIDVTKGQVEIEKTEEQMKKVLKEEELDKIKGKKTQNIKLKSKIYELFK